MAGDGRRGRRDNGLDAVAFVPLLDVDPRVGEHLLDVLGSAGVPAYLEPSADVEPYTRALSLPSPPTDRLWVDRDQRRQARMIVDAETPHGPRPVPPARDDEPSHGLADADEERAWQEIIAGFDAPPAAGRTGPPRPDAPGWFDGPSADPLTPGGEADPDQRDPSDPDGRGDADPDPRGRDRLDQGDGDDREEDGPLGRDGLDPRDFLDPGDPRGRRNPADPRPLGPRESLDSRERLDPRRGRDARDPLDPREWPDPRDWRDPRDLHETRDPDGRGRREPGDPPRPDQDESGWVGPAGGPPDRDDLIVDPWSDIDTTRRRSRRKGGPADADPLPSGKDLDRAAEARARHEAARDDADDVWIDGPPTLGDDDEHFEPPPPPPYPRLSRNTVLAVLLLLLGILLMAVPQVIGMDDRTGLTLGVLSVLGGGALLVLRMREARDEDGPDDGAVV
jgi:hypothetical protein